MAAMPHIWGCRVNPDYRWTTPEQLVTRLRDMQRMRNYEITLGLIVGMLAGACVMAVLQ